MPTPDNRIRLTPTRIDFDTDVGVTGQDHDNYPAAGQQPRFDWMRSYLIGLLSTQSSYEEPTQYRDGTLWFDLTTQSLKYRSGTDWAPVSDALLLGEDAAGDPITLTDVYATISTLLGNRPTASFSGHSSRDGAVSIPIPASLRAAAGAGSRPFVWVDGVLLDPRLCRFGSGTTPVVIELTGTAEINADQTFTVIMISVDDTLFYGAEVVL